jgi:anhydro-N-acetylmuramic acid kinase
MDRLDRARAKPSRLIVGLNSGTSMDGVDALLVRVTGSGASVRLEPIRLEKTAFQPALRARLIGAPDLSCEEVCRLNREVGEVFAAAVLSLARSAGFTPAEIDLVASHGQTVCHLPVEASGTSTLQIGDLDVIAAAVDLPVIGDFRAADVAHGGAGAPLMPYLDRVLFAKDPGTVTLNLGGITSLTWVYGDEWDPIAFDVGPANVPLDLLARRITRGAQSADVDGRLAASGRVQEDVVSHLLAHTFLHRGPPKTSGREEFGEAYVASLIDRYGHFPLVDLLASHTAFVGRSVAHALREWVPFGLDEGVVQVVASGGGIHNPVLMAGLRTALGPVPVRTLADFGIDPDAKEALLFALLGNERLFGRPSNIPSVTGARKPVSLGKIAGG